jgi:hypothetical protein
MEPSSTVAGCRFGAAMRCRMMTDGAPARVALGGGGLMNTSAFRLTLGLVPSAGAFALMLAMPVVPDTLQFKAALAASAGASSESHSDRRRFHG